MDYTTNYDIMYGDDMSSTGMAILAIYLIVLTVMFIFYVISYIFKGVGMHTIAKRLGMSCPWLAFIPFARVYLQGEIAGEVQLKQKSIRNPGIPLLAFPFIAGIINFIMYMFLWIVGFAGIIRSSMNSSSLDFGVGMVTGMLAVGVIWMVLTVLYSAVYKGFGIVVNHQIFAKFTTKNMSILHAVFGKFVPLYESLCFFAMRNRDFNPGMEPAMRPEVKPVFQGAVPQVEEIEAPQGEAVPEAAPEVIIPPAPQDEVATEAAPEAAPEVIIPPAPQDEVATEAAPEVIIPPAPQDEVVTEAAPEVIIPPAPQDQVVTEAAPEDENSERSQ